MYSVNRDRSPLSRLNTDVLLQIFELLRPKRGLRSLSATCKSLRSESIPILFKRCSAAVHRPIVLQRFIPPILWAHCQSLSLADYCPDIMSMRDEDHRLCYSDDRLLCGVMDGQVLKTVLPSMPRLRSITVSFLCDEVHGLKWETLISILSAQQLENFLLVLFNFSPRPRLPTDVHALSLAPLKSFRYIQPAFRREPYCFPLERDALADVLMHMHDSLEVLHLPSMSTPLHVLSAARWPHLRELVLQGELPEGPFLPFVTLLSGMPKLRVLHVMFALPFDVPPQAIWPRNLDTTFPWPELEDLVVSFPAVEDRLYPSLPPSLRRLSLPCCPHHCAYSWMEEHPAWHSPILSATEMLWVLSRCQLPHLEHLQFEYRTDDADISLLRHVKTAFPQLLTLEVHRFRPAGLDEIPVVAIAEEIRALTRLHTLSINLDPPNHPIPRPLYVRVGGYQLGLTYAQAKLSHSMLQAHAELLAPLLGRSVRLLRLVQRKTSEGVWQAYHIFREDTGDVIRIQADYALSNEVLSPTWFVEVPELN